jgi:dipeptidyl-peptidase-4
MADSFPRQYTRTQRLTLGEPRTVTVSPDERRVVFVRSRAGDDPVGQLHVLDLETGDERVVVDPSALLATGAGDAGDDLPAEERARRERMRESAGGVTAYATDRDVTVVACALNGRLFVGGLVSGAARELPVEGPVVDPRPDPLARRLAYLAGNRLRIAELDGSSWELAGEDDPLVSWGAADFVAAEEMHRFRGYWWSPDGDRIAACRVDEHPVQEWWIGDPAYPRRTPTAIRYPAAGTANPDVTLHVLDLDGGSVEVTWDRDALPYLADVGWIDDDRLLVTVQSRDQRRLVVMEANASTGDTAPLFEDADDTWVELVPGSPATTPTGSLLVAADRGGRRCLLLDGVEITPDDVQVRAVSHVGDATVTFLGNPLDDPTVQYVYRWTGAGDVPHDGSVERLTDEPGVHTVSAVRPTVVRSASLGRTRPVTTAPGGRIIESFAEEALVRPDVHLHRLGADRLATAVLLPHDHDGSPLPVLLDPYGGPHAQRVVQNHHAFVSSQWFADQGYAVVVVDGRGTPGRGSAWERAVHHDLATPVLDDQITALQAAAELHPELDLDRVAIRGWSFGGYLAALAVLRRPDVFHAAIAGAPVTEWRLYDTHYTERYLGDPTVDAGPYADTSLLPLASQLRRPLLLVHGLADDNVVAAHSLQLSSALLAAGRPHELLALVGVTHMTPQEVVAENLLLHQLDFLRRSLAR